MLACVALATLVSGRLYAGGEHVPASSITLEMGRDSADTNDAYLDADLGFTNGLHLRGMVGGSRQESATETYTSRSRLLGISSDYSAPVVAGFDYEYWGEDDSMSTRTKRFKLGINTDNWYVQLIYEDRNTELTTNGSTVVRRGKLVKLPDNVDVASTGKGINISYYGFYPWSVSVAYIKYDYEKDVTALEKYPLWAQSVFAASTLGMATGLESWRRSADLSYNFDWGAIGVSGSQSESVVDQSIASSGAVYVSWDISKLWTMTVTAGQSGVDNTAEKTNYARAALTHRW